ncbi:MAG: diacylglycerol kinase [Clostridia bacterium]
MKRHWLKWICMGLGLLTFLLIALNLNNASAVDSAVYRAVSKLYSSPATGLFIGFSQMAGPVVLLIISLALVFLLPKNQYRIPLLINLCLCMLLNLGLKHLFLRERPVDVVRLITETGYSFPSGHAMMGTCFYGFLIYLLWQLCHRKVLRNLLTAFLSLIIVLICTSRIYLGVHFFTDVFAGMCISVCYLIVFTSLVDRFFKHDESVKLPGMVINDNNRFLFSFVYAFNGILSGVKSERNMVIHFSALTTVTVFGALLDISQTEWIACIILFGVVIMAELMNTAIETVVDMICPQKDPHAKIAKDTAAGAVLMVAIAAAVVGAIIFVPKLMALVSEL